LGGIFRRRIFGWGKIASIETFPVQYLVIRFNRLCEYLRTLPSFALQTVVSPQGNSLVRGPSDVIRLIYDKIGGTQFHCSVPHTLAFQIGGKMFPIDPRDFARQMYTNSVKNCIPNIAATDPPKVGGFLYSWSLGNPFLKS